MKIFISHKQEDALAANQMATQLREMKVDYYLDLLDSSVVQSGKELTNLHVFHSGYRLKLGWQHK